ncbi:MAG: radical SAM protein, partial [Chloroflexi bacterium]
MIWNEKLRRRLTRERGTILKDWGGKTPIALIYPNTYYIGMSNLGFQTIYRLLNSYDDIVCERVFWEDREKEPLSVESQRPLSDFAVLAFSISYELDYLNVVQLLKSSATPLFAADRDESHPLVIAGGPCVSANPEPLAPFFDCFAIGEGEVILPPMLKVITEAIHSKREELLQGLSSVPGIYVPSLHRDVPISRQWVRKIDDFATTSVILTPETELGQMYLIE